MITIPVTPQITLEFNAAEMPDGTLVPGSSPRDLEFTCKLQLPDGRVKHYNPQINGASLSQVITGERGSVSFHRCELYHLDWQNALLMLLSWNWWTSPSDFQSVIRARTDQDLAEALCEYFPGLSLDENKEFIYSHLSTIKFLSESHRPLSDTQIDALHTGCITESGVFEIDYLSGPDKIMVVSPLFEGETAYNVYHMLQHVLPEEEPVEEWVVEMLEPIAVKRSRSITRGVE